MAHKISTAIIDQDDKNYLERVADLPDDNFVAETNTALVAAFETSVITLSHACALLALNKQCQDKIYKEQMEILGDSERDITPEDLSKMKYLEYCLNETLRICPTVPVIGRMIREETDFGKYTVPANTLCLLFIYLVHRDPDQWEKPGEFYPEHFEPEKVNKRHPYSYVPFSSGGRQCLGYRYAMLSLKTALANIIRHFNISTDMELKDLQISRIVLLDAEPINIQLTLRKQIARDD